MSTNAAQALRPHLVPPPAPAPVAVEPVRTTAERDEFIELPNRLFASDPMYVPPISAERRDFLDRRRNPFLRLAEVQLFLARRDGSVVGRIAAINDPRYNQFHNTEVGFFGLYDSIDDEQVASALFAAAFDWVKKRGFKQVMGPVNLSTNHDCGLLVEGFDFPPAMMMPYNPRYYPALLEAQGLRKAKDLFSYEMSSQVAPPDKVVRVAEKVRAHDAVKVRPLNLADLPEEVRRIKGIYNAMIERSWGFVPMTEEEFDLIAARLTPLVRIRPELCLIAEVKGSPVAFSLTLPDSNRALKAANGHLTRYGIPVGLAKMAWAARSIDRLRVLLLGIKPGYRRRGIDALLYLETLRAARELGYASGEIGWTTEDNDLMNRAIELMGARKYKTYRIYGREL